MKPRLVSETQNGSVQTSECLSQLVAQRLFAHLKDLVESTTDTPVVFDPAMGEGRLLVAALQQCPHAVPTGTDLNADLVGRARATIGPLLTAHGNDMDVNRLLRVEDHLDVDSTTTTTPRVDLYLCNPPWLRLSAALVRPNALRERLHREPHRWPRCAAVTPQRLNAYHFFLERMPSMGAALFACILPDSVLRGDPEAVRMLLDDGRHYVDEVWV